MSEPFWYSQPNVLFSKDNWYKFVPTANMTVPAALNTVVRFAVYLSALLFLSAMDPLYLLMGPLVMGVTIVLNKLFPEAKPLKETFVSSYVGPDVSMPTPDNPFMNAPLTDILDNPNRPPAADVTRVDVREKVNEAFAKTSNMYMDTGDAYEMIQAQRNFHTIAEDDHEGLIQFLGKGARSDKLLSEGYVVAKGTVPELAVPSVAQPRGYSPQ